jgi:alpha-amylase
MEFFPWIVRSVALQALLSCTATAMMADGWRNRTIYQVLTDRFAIPEGLEVAPCDQQHLDSGIHCGGTWRGITEHLDYIQNMNFDAIWISPIVAQMPDWTSDGEAYPGYWQQSLYSINPSYGTEEDLNELITEIHNRGMLVMLDIVVNHMALPGPHVEDLDWAIMHPFNDKKYYHDYCVNGYDDQDLRNLQDCWLGGSGTLLADLNSESEEVQEMLALWIKNQIWKYGVDGLRIDAALNVPSEFFTKFMAEAGVFATSETYTEHVELACPYSETVGSMLNYPVYFPLRYALQGPEGNFQDLATTIKSVSDSCADTTVLGSFGEVSSKMEIRNSFQKLTI